MSSSFNAKPVGSFVKFCKALAFCSLNNPYQETYFVLWIIPHFPPRWSRDTQTKLLEANQFPLLWTKSTSFYVPKWMFPTTFQLRAIVSDFNLISLRPNCFYYRNIWNCFEVASSLFGCSRVCRSLLVINYLWWPVMFIDLAKPIQHHWGEF